MKVTNVNRYSFIAGLLAAVILGAVSTSAQFSFPTYAPKDCMGAAQRAITGATDTKVVGIVAIGVDVPLGATPINIGMSAKDGKATMWVYLVRSAEKDTVAFVPLIRLLGSCNPPPIPIPDDVFDPADAPQSALPADFTQGAALITALNKDAKFSRFRTAYPDSNASLAILSVSEGGAGGIGLGDGNVFWLLTWSAFADSAVVDTNSNGPDPGLTCIHNITTGETFCFDSSDVTSIADEALAQGFAVAPNPASDQAALTVPSSWNGTAVTIAAIDMTGRVYPMGESIRLDGIALPLNLSGLPSGMYTLHLQRPGASIAIPMSVLR
ncbi:MAG: Secretion system C-terminal sorting domain [Bacteroidota bacterium]|jgi:hypothetical protein